MASIHKRMPLTIILLVSFALLLILDPTEAKKQSSKRKEADGDDDNQEQKPNIRYPLGQALDSDRSNGFQGLQDTDTSAQGINPAIYQNQAGFGGLGAGLSNLGGGIYSNQAQLGQFGGIGGGINPYLQNGFGGGYQNGLLGGYQNGLAGGYQNPYLAGGFGGLGGGLGFGGDIYTQGALSAQLYNNPLIGAGSGTLTGSAAGINPLLLRGVQNFQYPVVGGLGNYNNPYLNAQNLLSPYSNYNQLNNYSPFTSRFGIGRSGLNGNRFNSQSANNNNDE